MRKVEGRSQRGIEGCKRRWKKEWLTYGRVHRPGDIGRVIEPAVGTTDGDGEDQVVLDVELRVSKAIKNQCDRRRWEIGAEKPRTGAM